MARLRLLAAALCFVPAAASADAYYEPAPKPRSTEADFWKDIVAPHGDEIDMIVGKANTAWNFVVQIHACDCDATGEARTKLLDDGYGMLRYARRLDPTRTDVLELLGKFAQESGRSTAAVEAYQAYFAELPPDATPSNEAHLRCGRAYLRLGRADDAIRQFRAGMVGAGSAWGPGAAALAYLGNTLMNRGRIADAIDLLAQQSVFNAWQPELLQSILTLAVAYDRDEQISRAFDVLDGLRNTLQANFLATVQQALAQYGFAPAHDQHYFYALAYESEGHLAEARTAWLLYSQADGASFRARALDHVAAIDQLLAAKLEAAAAAAKAKPQAPKPKPKRRRPRTP
jgi:tetratricopeptide (TPR) repeat protein